MDIHEGVTAGALNLHYESDGKIAFDSPLDFRVRVDIIALGEGCIERIHVTEPWAGGSVASMSDLSLLRAVTVVDRGDDGDLKDFGWLLAQVGRMGELPVVSDEEFGYLARAMEVHLGRLGKLVLAGILSMNNTGRAMQILQ